MSQYKGIRGCRIYEGEWSYVCQRCGNGNLIEFGLSNYDQQAGHSLNNLGYHNYVRCEDCGSELVWEGYAGGSPVTDSLISLLKNKHFMASTVILSAIVESAIRDLIWAALVDNGIDWERANKIADGRMNRIDSVNFVADLTGLKVKDIAFPYRNLVAHGKGFEVAEDEYREELIKQVKKIKEWVDGIVDGRNVDNYRPSQIDRWLLFMSYWANWFESYSITNYLQK
jgi:DNA-directed RNA polymerase subunit RPC12/RpoP